LRSSILRGGELRAEIEPAAVRAVADAADPLDPAGDRRRALVSALFPDVRMLTADDGAPGLRITAACEGEPAEPEPLPAVDLGRRDGYRDDV
jgi:hypothetical protein